MGWHENETFFQPCEITLHAHYLIKVKQVDNKNAFQIMWHSSPKFYPQKWMVYLEVSNPPKLYSTKNNGYMDIIRYIRHTCNM